MLAVDITEHYVLPCRLGVSAEVLEHDAVHIVECGGIVLADVASVKEDHALGGIVESREQLDKRGLACAVKSHEDYRLGGIQREVDVLDNVSVGTRVFEGHAAEFYGMRGAEGGCERLVGDGGDGYGLFRKVDDVIDEESSLIDRRRGGQKRGNVACDGGDSSRVERVITDSAVLEYDAICDIEEEGAVDEHREECDDQLCYSLLDDQRAQTLIVLFEHSLVLLDKGVAEAEDLDLLCHILIDHKA